MQTFLALSNFKVSGEVSVPKETSVSGGPPTLEDTTGDDTPTWGSSISGVRTFQQYMLHVVCRNLTLA